MAYSTDETELYFIKLTSNAISPSYSSCSAGFDLFSAEEKVVESESQDVIKTDIAIQLPSSTYGRICGISWHARQHSLFVFSDTIQQGYHSGIDIILFNHSKQDYEIKVGEMIARLFISKPCIPTLKESEGALPETRKSVLVELGLSDGTLRFHQETRDIWFPQLFG